MIYLKPNKESSAKRFHPWIFSGAIGNIKGEPQFGEIVSVYDHKNNFIGKGHYESGSIAVRLLTYNDEPINTNFWEQRIMQAFEVRKAANLIRKDNNAFRLVFGEGDFLPGLIIDCYGTTAVMQAHSAGMHLARFELSNVLKNIAELNLKSIYYKSSKTLEGIIPEEQLIDTYLIGGLENDIAIENGIKFHADWIKGQKTGFFVDQRDNRQLVEYYAKGRKVLNMFCYTGGFSLYALRGDATSVDSVDSSARAIELLEQNITLNFEKSVSNHKSLVVDAFKYLNDMGNDYDLIILDPPAFAKQRRNLKNGLQGYRKINLQALEKIKPGGLLFTFSCSQAVSPEQFRLSVLTAAVQAKRKVRILHQLTQPIDHPISIFHPEGEYLKGLVLYVE